MAGCGETNSKKDYVEMLKAVSEQRYNHHKDDQCLRETITVCSWNYAPSTSTTLDRQDAKGYIRCTLDEMLPAVIMIQEATWVDPVKHLTMFEEKEHKYSIYFRGSGLRTFEKPRPTLKIDATQEEKKTQKVEATQQKQEVCICYDPKFVREYKSTDISNQWDSLIKELCDQAVMATAKKGTVKLYNRTIAFGAEITFSLELDEFEVKEHFIFISMHMFNILKGVTDKDIADIISAVIDSALKLADMFKTTVIMGADWNFEVQHIDNLIASKREKKEWLTVTQEFHKLAAPDCIIIIHPSKPEQQLSMFNNSRTFVWHTQLSDKILLQCGTTENERPEEVYKSHLPNMLDIKFSAKLKKGLQLTTEQRDRLNGKQQCLEEILAGHKTEMRELLKHQQLVLGQKWGQKSSLEVQRALRLKIKEQEKKIKKIKDSIKKKMKIRQTHKRN